MRRRLRLATVFVIIATTLVVLPQDVRACSCAIPNPHEWLANADAAFVGKVIEAPEEATHGGAGGLLEGEYIFQVDQAVKGDLPETITVLSAIDGAACGLGQGVGVRRGVFLRLVGGHWTTNSCSMVASDLLLAAAEPLPEPASDSPIVALASVITPEGRTVAIDAEGNVVAYGAGRGKVNAYALCPGNQTVIEHAFDRTDSGLPYLIAVRDLRGFHVTREIASDDVPGIISVTDIACLDPDGDEVLLLVGGDMYEPSNGRIMRLRGDTFETLAELPVPPGCHSLGAFDIPNSLAYFTAGPDCMSVYRYDMASGATTELVIIPSAVEMDAISAFALSPDGRYLALRAGGPRIQTYRLLVADLHAEPVNLVEGVYRHDHHGYNSFWLAHDRLLVAGPAQRGEALVVDPQLEIVATIDGLAAGPGGMLGERIYVAGFGGRVMSAPADGGAAREIHTFLDPDVRAFAVLPEPVPYDPAARQPDNLSAAVPAPQPTEEPGVSEPTGALPVEANDEPESADPLPDEASSVIDNAADLPAAKPAAESEDLADGGTVALLAGASLGLVFAGAVIMPLVRDRRGRTGTPG